MGGKAAAEMMRRLCMDFWRLM